MTELLTLSVTATQRGAGIGTALLDEFHRSLERTNHHGLVGVLPGNHRAIELYQRHGYRPAFLTMTRFGRSPAGPVRNAPPPTRRVEHIASTDVDSLRGLWLQLHHHHQTVADPISPFVGDNDSWTVIESAFRHAAGNSLLFRVGPTDWPLAVACVEIDHDTLKWTDTWHVDGPIGEITVLVTDSTQRGKGLGTVLMSHVDVKLADRGITDQIFGAIAPNVDAIRLYQRRGFRPAWLQLTRWNHQPIG